MTEVELRKELRKSLNDSETVQHHMSLLTRVRIAFWDEYERAAHAQEVMNVNNLYRGVCRNSIYFGLFRKHPILFAWVICPLSGYLLTRRELEILGQERMIEVMSESAVKPDGRVDSRLAKVQFEMYEALQNRIHGSITQKIESQQKSVNVNVNTTQTSDEGARTIALITSVEELDRRIKAVQEKRLAMKTIAQPIEINQDKLMLKEE